MAEHIGSEDVRTYTPSKKREAATEKPGRHSSSSFWSPRTRWLWPDGSKTRMALEAAKATRKTRVPLARKSSMRLSNSVADSEETTSKTKAGATCSTSSGAGEGISSFIKIER